MTQSYTSMESAGNNLGKQSWCLTTKMSVTNCNTRVDYILAFQSSGVSDAERAIFQGVDVDIDYWISLLDMHRGFSLFKLIIVLSRSCLNDDILWTLAYLRYALAEKS